MKFTCESESLAQALKKLMKMVPRGKGALAALLKLIATLAGTVILRVIHKDTMLQAELPAYIEQIGSVSLSPAPLAELVEGIASPDRVITLEHHAAIGEVEVTSVGIDQKLSVGPEQEETIPALEDADVNTAIRLSAASLKRALDRLAPVLADAENLGSIKEMALDIDAENRVTLVSTDSVRLAMVPVAEARVESDVVSQRVWSLMASDVRLLASVLNGDTKAGDELTLKIGSGQWGATWGRFQLVAPLSEREFPRWRSIRPAAFTSPTMPARVRPVEEQAAVEYLLMPINL